jgi:hypothetical protein
MPDVQHLLQRQAAWQRDRRALPWPEKIRMVEAIRESVLWFAALRTSKSGQPIVGSSDQSSSDGAAAGRQAKDLPT